MRKGNLALARGRDHGESCLHLVTDVPNPKEPKAPVDALVEDYLKGELSQQLRIQTAGLQRLFDELARTRHDVLETFSEHDVKDSDRFDRVIASHVNYATATNQALANLNDRIATLEGARVSRPGAIVPRPRPTLSQGMPRAIAPVRHEVVVKAPPSKPPSDPPPIFGAEQTIGGGWRTPPGLLEKALGEIQKEVSKLRDEKKAEELLRQGAEDALEKEREKLVKQREDDEAFRKRWLFIGTTASLVFGAITYAIAHFAFHL